MKLLEEWPTEAMIAAGKRAIEKHRRDQDQSLNNLAEWVFRYMFAAAPTPPAQEDVPVAWLYEHDGMIHASNHPPIITTEKWANCKEPWSETPLYTRPDDKLRKAAEEASELLNDLLKDGLISGYLPGMAAKSVQKKLHAALEGK